MEMDLCEITFYTRVLRYFNIKSILSICLKRLVGLGALTHPKYFQFNVGLMSAQFALALDRYCLWSA